MFNAWMSSVLQKKEKSFLGICDFVNLKLPKPWHLQTAMQWPLIQAENQEFKHVVSNNRSRSIGRITRRAGFCNFVQHFFWLLWDCELPVRNCVCRSSPIGQWESTPANISRFSWLQSDTIITDRSRTRVICGVEYHKWICQFDRPTMYHLEMKLTIGYPLGFGEISRVDLN